MNRNVCRSCGAPIDWAYTEKGRRIPLDAGLFDDGNIVIGDDEIAHVVGPLDQPDVPRRRAHFVSCPNADRHRKGAHRRGRSAHPERPT